MTPVSLDDPNYTYEPCIYPLQIALTANQALRNQKVGIDSDSDFILTGVHGTSTGAFNINFKLPSGRMVSNNLVQSANLIGTANQPAAFAPMLYKKGGLGPATDLTDTSGAGNTVEIIYDGYRRFPVGS
ncbi:MAG: hypothetical protein M3N93_11165 [Acidobacteriota bacterium]|nr:hypothetical protein [Acidobacteriota bacterium]